MRSVFRKANKRGTRNKKYNRKRRTKRVYKMRGGWGGNAPILQLNTNNEEEKYPATFMMGGWGGPVIF
jgi:hypothetical protein